MTKTELNGYVYEFSADYDAIVVDDIFNINKSFMINNIQILKKSLNLLEKCLL